jgi:hypothetical protein
MITRATFSLQKENIDSLKVLMKDFDKKSVSCFVNDIISSFLKEQNKISHMNTLEKNYKKYAQNTTQESKRSFQEIEQCAFTDLFNK